MRLSKSLQDTMDYTPTTLYGILDLDGLNAQGEAALAFELGDIREYTLSIIPVRGWGQCL